MAKYRALPEYDYYANQAQQRASQNLFNRIGQMQGNELIGTPGFLAGGPDAQGQLARLRRGILARGVAQGADAMAGLQSDLALDRLNFIKEQIRNRQKKEASKGNVFKKIGGAALGAGIGFVTGGPAGAAVGAGNSILGTDYDYPRKTRKPYQASDAIYG